MNWFFFWNSSSWFRWGRLKRLLKYLQDLGRRISRLGYIFVGTESCSSLLKNLILKKSFSQKSFFIFSCRSFGIKWIRWDKWLIYDVSYKQKRVALLCESKSVISGAHLCLVVGWCRMCNHLMRTPWWLKIQERMNVVIEEYMTQLPKAQRDSLFKV